MDERSARKQVTNKLLRITERSATDTWKISIVLHFIMGALCLPGSGWKTGELSLASVGIGQRESIDILLGFECEGRSVILNCFEYRNLQSLLGVEYLTLKSTTLLIYIL